MKKFPVQPRLTRHQLEAALGETHSTSVEADDDPYISFVWGFDPYPEAGLPFFFRVEVSYQEQAPVFVPEIRSVALMFAAVETWFRQHERRPMLWSEHEEVAGLIREHLLLRAALGQDRAERTQHRIELLREVARIFGDDTPPAQYVRVMKTKYGEWHPMVLAAAYDAWRLGDYRDAKGHLMRYLGFEPNGPAITFT